MHLYRTFNSALSPEAVAISWDATQSDAHNAAKGFGLFARPDMRIELVEVPTDRDSLLGYLRGAYGTCKVLKTWKLTDRGGLHDCANGE